MLKDTELDELARAVASLDDEDAGRLDRAVRERRRAKVEAEEGIRAWLRSLSDEQAFEAAMSDVVMLGHPQAGLKVLRDAGFVRQPAQPAGAFCFRDVPIRTMADGTTACGSWEAFCDQIAWCAVNGMGPFEATKLLAHVAALVPEEMRDAHRAEMLQRVTGRRS
ncbi:hypothetical protein [Methylorubrum sp. SB2]|uniref:hypothetical protein n=1 Tax=Methylorubrum subtropicum TaxID=3138812 RepID=UPI00313B51D4